MKVRVWRYRVSAEHRGEFEREYGPHGSWARLFARSPGFVDTTLYADVGSTSSYLTVDRFTDEAAWAAFRSGHAAAYEALGARLAHLTGAQEALV